MNASVENEGILFISSRSDIGGGPGHLVDLTTNLKALGFKKSIYIASPLAPPHGQKLKSIAEKHFEIPERKFSLPVFFRLFKFCINNHIKTIHSHGRGAGIYSRLLKLFKNFTIIHTFHGIHLEKSFTGLIKWNVDKALKPLTDYFVCVSKDEQIEAISYNQCTEAKSICIVNGVDSEAIAQNYSAHKLADTIQMGTLARLTYQKGIDIALKYIKEFKAQYPEIKFKYLIAGDGEDKVNLEKQCQELGLSGEVDFVGNTAGPGELLSKVDVYLSFSRWEGLPLSLLEAMSVGMPCLVSNVVGHTTLIDHGENGLKFELESSTDFKEKCLMLCQDNKLREKIRGEAKALIEKKYTAKSMAKKYIELY
ncbi:MAG: glycosyltransferase [Bacteriovoracaceae bacterium]|nr:glycosyltransferase [Bacteriovoracaceae bacterium]